MIKRLIPFIFAGVLGLVAVVMMHQYLTQQRQLLEQERAKLLAEYQAPLDVFVARTDLPADTTIASEHLELRAIPEKFIQPYASSNAGDLIGRITLAPIAGGEQILVNKLRRPGEAAGALSRITPAGQRAVTIGTDVLTGVGGFVRPGDTVDVLWTISVPRPGSQEGEPVTLTLFQDVQVLAVGGQMVGGSGEAVEAGAGDYTVTLALDPQQTALLLYAREQGRIELSLRSLADKDKRVPVVPADMAMVMQSLFGQVAPGEEPKPQRTVEVFKGLERSVVTIEE